MIEVRNLTKSYDGFRAVDAISFTVEEGDIYGFIGPNGAGKTTTIRILSTLLEPTAGRAFIGGYDVVNEPEKVRKLIGFMPDYYGVYEGITIQEYLEFFAAAYHLPRGQRTSVVRDIMELTDLGPLSEKLVATLSKGQKQRLCLAKTLIHDPRVLILDEPAAGLDPRARIEIRSLLKELARMGKTIFISSHILAELSGICNTVGIIEKGKLLATGDVDGIRTKLGPHRLLTIRALSRLNEAKTLLEERDDVEFVELKEDNALSVTFVGEEELIYTLVRALVERDIPIIGLEEKKQDLEDLFMKITKGEIQ